MSLTCGEINAYLQSRGIAGNVRVVIDPGQPLDDGSTCYEIFVWGQSEWLTQSVRAKNPGLRAGCNNYLLRKNEHMVIKYAGGDP